MTGGDSGIGRAVALAYAREGAHLVIPYLNEHEDAKVSGETLWLGIDIQSFRWMVCQTSLLLGVRSLLKNTVRQDGPRAENMDLGFGNIYDEAASECSLFYSRLRFYDPPCFSSERTSCQSQWLHSWSILYSARY